MTPDLRLLADSHPFSAVTLLPGFLLSWLLRPAFLWVRSHGLGMGPLLVLTEQAEHVGLECLLELGAEHWWVEVAPTPGLLRPGACGAVACVD